MLAAVLVIRYDTDYDRDDNCYRLGAPATAVKATLQSARSGKTKACTVESIKAKPWVSTSAKGDQTKSQPEGRGNSHFGLQRFALPSDS